jgi:hypothetical protein
MLSKTALIITSISQPNDVLSSYAKGSGEHGIDFIVIGDVKSPSDFTLSGCDFWGIERQHGLDFQLAKMLPVQHYARKNLGYLIAMDRGADVIIETDDDNFPQNDFWLQRTAVHSAKFIENAGWINVYQYFTRAFIWPRGFPLEFVRQPVIPIDSFPEHKLFCPIQQGLADDNPDVDAVYRLIMPLPVRFSNNFELVLGRASWSPLNSQNTTWFREAFPLLYIPSYCSFRMCDIWRGFVALRICSANAWGILFHNATVRQERNEHNLMRDLEDEIPGYLNNSKICDTLAGLEMKPGTENIDDNMLKCYQALIDIGVVSREEINLLKSWLYDIKR